jgi:hypothetical protein
VLRRAIEALRLDPADGTFDNHRRWVTRRAAGACRICSRVSDAVSVWRPCASVTAADHWLFDLTTAVPIASVPSKIVTVEPVGGVWPAP